MCGIIGYFNLNSNFRSKFEDSLKMLSHRGPDQFGISDVQLNNCVGQLGHARLSIIDLSELGRQPMKSKCERYNLVFNGEIYNYKELKAELKELKYQFVSNSDTEVLLASWIIWGEKCLTKLIGMFSFVIYDSKMNSLTCVRDPFGIKPFYYSNDLSNFYFASEIPALTNLNPKLNVPNIQKSYEYLSNGTYDNDQSTFFENISQLLPGHLLKLDLNINCKVKIDKWWWPSIKQTSKLSFEDASLKLREMFLNNVKLHLRSDVPIGAALSGGVDSSAIVSCIRHIEPKQGINTFSFIANDSIFNEEKWVDIVNNSVDANKYKINSSSVNLYDDFDNLLKTQGEPFGSTSIYAQYKLYELVKESGVTVLLEGQGADELLAGYGGFPVQRIQSLIDECKLGGALSFLLSWGKLPNRSIKSTLIALFYNILPYKLKKIISAIKKKRSFPKYLNKDLVSKSMIKIDYNEKLSKPKDIKGRHLINLLRDSVTGKGLSSLLRHGDRSSMKFSLESRVPFLTIDIAEFIFSLPEEYLVSNKGVTKHIFRDAMKGIVAKEILERKDKIGFEPPENQWLESLKPHISSVIEDIKKTPILDTNVCIQTIENYFIDPNNSDSRVIWRIINYTRWYAINFND